MSQAQVARRFIDSSFGQIHLREAGEAGLKPVVMCLHMIPKSSRSFARLMPELAAQRYVVAPDYPGYGESDLFRNMEAPTIKDYADAIAQVIEHLQISTLDLIGYHTGSMIAVLLAHQYPKLVRRVINISAPIFTKQEVDDFHQYFAPIPLDEAGTRFRTMWQRIIKYRGPQMTFEMAAASMAENLRGGERYEDGHAAAFNFTERYAELLEQIEQPLWVMNFGDDLFEHSKRAKRHFNNGALTNFPEWGHGSLDVWPEQVASEMLNFLDKTQ